MVTELQLYKTAKSLFYRRKLEEGIGELEQTIYKYMKETNLTHIAIGDYHLLRENRDITVYEIPRTNADQFTLWQYDEKKRKKDREN